MLTAPCLVGIITVSSKGYNMNIMSYAASQSNPPKGYGKLGLDVAMYRGAQTRKYKLLGFDHAGAATLAHNDVLVKYGPAK
mgnify:CR=1 FL=1